MKTYPRIAASPILALLLIINSSFAWADSPAPSPTPKPDTASVEDEFHRAVSEHTALIGKEKITYTATADYVKLWKDPDASSRVAKGKMFYVAYTRKGVDINTRPIAFCFNGGPGSAALWLHFGLGPRNVKLNADGSDVSPPFHLDDNAESWLDDTDLVFVDPIPTGYSRPVSDAKAEEFEGYQPDLDAAMEFIRSYIQENKRWLSPKILIGESYGTIRVCGLASQLPEKEQIGINGIVLISQALNFESESRDLLSIPSYAATAWYHGKIEARYRSLSLDQVCAAAESFVRDEYAPALFQGDALSPERSQHIASVLSDLTGMDADDIQRNSLQVSGFESKLLKSGTRHIGMYDSRYVYLGKDYDPFDGTPRNALVGAFGWYVSEELGIHTQLPYHLLAGVNWGGDMHANDFTVLQTAMTRNPGIKVLIADGRYDLVTPYYSTSYGLGQLHLDPDMRSHIEVAFYPAGHMSYFDKPSAILLKADFDRWINKL